MSTYKDANLYHDWTTGRAVTGILHFLNGTPVDWYSKQQNTVETATYGSNFAAARIATDQIIDPRMALRYLGVPVVEKSYLFGDNQSVVTSFTISHSSLNKRHNAMLYHRVWEAIAGKILAFFHIDGKTNPSDVLTNTVDIPMLGLTSSGFYSGEVFRHLWKRMMTTVFPITMRRHRPKWLQNGVY